MKSIHFISAALLLFGSVAASAQNVGGSKQEAATAYKYSIYCSEGNKTTGRTHVIAFNPHSKTLIVTTPKGDKSKVGKATQRHFKKYKSLKNADYQTSGEIRFANENDVSNFEMEATDKLKKKIGTVVERVVSYNAETGNASYMGFYSSGYSFDVDKKLMEGQTQRQSVDGFIYVATKGRFATKEEFDKAYKAKDPMALKYAERMNIKRGK